MTVAPSALLYLFAERLPDVGPAPGQTVRLPGGRRMGARTVGGEIVACLLWRLMECGRIRMELQPKPPGDPRPLPPLLVWRVENARLEDPLDFRVFTMLRRHNDLVRALTVGGAPREWVTACREVARAAGLVELVGLTRRPEVAGDARERFWPQAEPILQGWSAGRATELGAMLVTVCRHGMELAEPV